MRPVSFWRNVSALRAVLILVAAWMLAMPGFAGSAEAAVVNRIEVEGNQRVDADTIRAYLLIRPGVDYSRRDEDDSLKALFDTGLFSDVQLSTRGATLFVIVVENPVINEIAFEGNRRYKDNQLSAVIQSKSRDVFTRAKVQNDVARLLELYRRTGRFQASVTPEIIELPNNRVNLVFVFTEGPKTGVSGITFIGNHAFGDARLRNVIATRQSGILSFLRSGDNYDPDRLSSDEEKIRQYYLDRGFADFQIVSSVAELDRERNAFFIAFTLNEGLRYRYGAISVDSTIPGIDPAVLQRQVLTREGHVFSATEVEKSLEEITLYLASSGYPFVQVRPRLSRDPDLQTISIEYVVDEGSHVYVGRIEIRGNTRTRDYVIRREFDIAEGDAYNRVLVDRAERRLKRLGYFSEVRIFTEPGATEDRVDIIVEVVEEPTGELSFGIGYSTSDGVVGDVSLTEKNFLGRGYTLRVAVGAGETSRTYEVGFTDPYFLGRRISAGVNVFRREYSENSYRSYDYQTTGGGITFGLPVTEDLTVQTGYKIELQDIQVDAADCDGVAPDISLAICSAAGETLVSSVFYSVIYDTLDDYRDPHDGIFAKFTQEFAGAGGDVAYVRSTGSASYYRELLADRDIVGLLKVQGGHIVGIGQTVRILDEFMKGGETVRGFQTSGFGPRDSVTGDALGGNIFVAGTAEVQFPFPLFPPELGFKGAFFADAGTLFDSDATVAAPSVILDGPDIRSSVGGSILWASPLGPLRADFAYVLTSESHDRLQFFRFGGGTRF
ncbi:MAG: outer membrane protein assembly factor BamA [Propylenella sp.]